MCLAEAVCLSTATVFALDDRPRLLSIMRFSRSQTSPTTGIHAYRSPWSSLTANSVRARGIAHKAPRGSAHMALPVPRRHAPQKGPARAPSKRAFSHIRPVDMGWSERCLRGKRLCSAVLPLSAVGRRLVPVIVVPAVERHPCASASVVA